MKHVDPKVIYENKHQNYLERHYTKVIKTHTKIIWTVPNAPGYFVVVDEAKDLRKADYFTIPNGTFNSVTKPEHYNKNGIECLDAIEASMTKEEFEGYLKGNIIKYNWRYRYKNGLEDLQKAEFYLKRLIRTHGKAYKKETQISTKQERSKAF